MNTPTQPSLTPEQKANIQALLDDVRQFLLEKMEQKSKYHWITAPKTRK
jgi:hypothetical protein